MIRLSRVLTNKEKNGKKRSFIHIILRNHTTDASILVRYAGLHMRVCALTTVNTIY